MKSKRNTGCPSDGGQPPEKPSLAFHCVNHFVMINKMTVVLAGWRQFYRCCTFKWAGTGLHSRGLTECPIVSNCYKRDLKTTLAKFAVREDLSYQMGNAVNWYFL